MNYLLLLPIIIQAIKAAEELLPESVGKEKFSFVVDTLEMVSGVAVSNVPALEKYVTVIVTLFKFLGIFQSKSA